MKMKRIISLVCVLMLVTSYSAYGAALRTDPKKNRQRQSKLAANDIWFSDFYDEDIPAEVQFSTSPSGTVSLEEHETSPGQKKNCLVLNDTVYDNSYSGVGVSINAGGQKGIVGVEIRYMYVPEPDQACKFASFVMGLYDASNKMISRNVVISSNGATVFNYGGPAGCGEKYLETATISSNTWYTEKWIVDLDEKIMNFSFFNEGKAIRELVTDAGYYTTDAGSTLGKIRLGTQMYGGRYVIDYVRITKEKSRTIQLDEEIEDKGKGTVSEKILVPVSEAVGGKINICLDGVYKYTTEAPYEKDGKIMVTAKNLASFLRMGYSKGADACLIVAPSGKLTLKADGTASMDGKSVSVSAMEEKGKQIFVPVDEICAILGYQCSYDVEGKVVNITTVSNDSSAEKDAKGGAAVEK